MTIRSILSLVAAAAFAACGGGEPADSESGGTGGEGAPAPAPSTTTPAPPSGPLTVPDWYTVDNDARTVTMEVVGGLTPDNNYWNFNGAINGNMAITVPEGYRVVIDFVNRDPNMAHSLGISAETSNFATPPQPNPVFEGAITENPGSMVDGTMPGERETVEFVAERAGSYSMVCYIPGHTAVGMWLYFNVSANGEAGIQTR
ncbi:MAG TPA: sulfocyanin-like copper-binding protein [Longimicrobiales bacterium]|nr:sulfocyanin-like copper-binding protein [Longimicrobiales bacterium]